MYIEQAPFAHNNVRVRYCSVCDFKLHRCVQVCVAILRMAFGDTYWGTLTGQVLAYSCLEPINTSCSERRCLKEYESLPKFSSLSCCVCHPVTPAGFFSYSL